MRKTKLEDAMTVGQEHAGEPRSAAQLNTSSCLTTPRSLHGQVEQLDFSRFTGPDTGRGHSYTRSLPTTSGEASYTTNSRQPRSVVAFVTMIPNRTPIDFKQLPLDSAKPYSRNLRSNEDLLSWVEDVGVKADASIADQDRDLETIPTDHPTASQRSRQTLQGGYRYMTPACRQTLNDRSRITNPRRVRAQNPAGDEVSKPDSFHEPGTPPWITISTSPENAYEPFVSELADEFNVLNLADHGIQSRGGGAQDRRDSVSSRSQASHKSSESGSSRDIQRAIAGKRKALPPGEDQDSNDEDYPDDPRQSQTPGTAEAVPPKFVCPFYAQDRRKYPKCHGLMLHKVGDVTSHVRRAHLKKLPYRFNCCMRVATEREAVEHRGSEQCSWQDTERDCIVELKVRKKPKSVTEVQQWHKIYEILFPKNEKPVTAYREVIDAYQLHYFLILLGPELLSSMDQKLDQVSGNHSLEATTINVFKYALKLCQEANSFADRYQLPEIPALCTDSTVPTALEMHIDLDGDVRTERPPPLQQTNMANYQDLPYASVTSPSPENLDGEQREFDPRSYTSDSDSTEASSIVCLEMGDVFDFDMYDSSRS